VLWPGDWKQQLAQLNDERLKEYRMKSKNKVAFVPSGLLLNVNFSFSLVLLSSQELWEKEAKPYLKRSKIGKKKDYFACHQY
jgi:hypothetical protein